MASSVIAPSNLKKQLRDVSRLISRPNLPADIRREQERKLQHIKLLIEERKENEKVMKMSKRYAKVRFFESKKAQRHVKQAARLLLEKSTEENLAKWMEAKRDEIYVHSFPRDRKYIGLFPSTPLTDEKVLAMRTQVRSDLAAEHGFAEEIRVDDALAMVRKELERDGPRKVEENALEAVEAAKLRMNTAFAAGNKRGKAASDDEDQDDEEEEESDDDMNGYDDDDDLEDDEEEEGEEEDDDESDEGDNEGENGDSSDDDTDEGEAEGEEDDGDSDDDEEDYDDDDDDEEGYDEEEEDEDEDGDEDEEELPKKARH